MQYSFDVQEAVDYGDREAIIIWNLRFWIVKNKANGKHLYAGSDGIFRTWTYNTTKAFAELFPFWSEDQIDRLIKKMIEKKIIIKDNFNSNSYDRTSWYAFQDEEKMLSPHLVLAHFADSRNGSRDSTESSSRKRKLDSAKSENGAGENAESYTDFKTNIKPFLSLPTESKKEILKKIWEEKNLKSSCEKYFLFREKSNWKGVSNLEADIAWWENGFREKNPDKYVEKKAVVGDFRTTESPEITKIRSQIKFKMHEHQTDLYRFFVNAPIEKTDSGFKILVENKEALKYREILEEINVKIEVK